MNTPISQLPEWRPGMETIDSSKQNRLTDIVRELANRTTPREPNLAPGPGRGGSGWTFYKVTAVTTEFTCIARDPTNPGGGTIGDPFTVKAFSKRRADGRIGMVNLADCEPYFTVGDDLPVWDDEKHWWDGAEMVTGRQACPIFTETC